MNEELIGKAIAEVMTGPHWRINKNLARYIGLENALFLTHLLDHFRMFSKRKRLDEEGYFYLVQSDIEKKTTLSLVQQTLIIKKMTGQEPFDQKTKEIIRLIEVKKKGLPARNYYRIVFDKLVEILSMDLDEDDDENADSSSYSNLGASSYSNLGTSDPCIKGTKDINNIDINNIGINKSTSNEVDNAPDGALSYLENSSQDKPVLRRRKIPLSEKPPYAPKDVKEIIDAWEGIGFPGHKNHTSKIYNGTVYSLKKLRRGVFFNDLEVYNDYKDRKFTKEEIVDAIKNFAWFVNNLNFSPTNGYRDRLRKTTLLDFLYNPFAKKDRSLLLKYIDLPPNNHPEMSKILFGSFKGMRRGIGELSVKERAKLVSGSNRLWDFYDKNRKKIYPQFIRTAKDKAELLVDALKDRFADGRIEAGHFCSDYTFNTVLPQYLERQAVLVDENIIG